MPDDVKEYRLLYPNTKYLAYQVPWYLMIEIKHRLV